MKTFILTHCFLSILALSCDLYSQVSQEWVARYSHQNYHHNVAYSLAVDGSGNIYVTGKSLLMDTTYDYATIKYNSAGAQQWVQRYNGPGNGNDEAYSLAVDSSGNVYVTGLSWGSGTTYDYATIKYNSAGAQQWVQRYNGPGNEYDEAFSLAVDGSGNTYVTGSSFTVSAPTCYATIKYNSSGVVQWVQRYNGPGNTHARAYEIAVDVTGNVYVTGSDWGSGSSDYATIKYDNFGAQQWVQRYNGPGNGTDTPTSLALDSSGNVYVTGWSWGGFATSSDYATVKYNSAGVQQWIQRFNGDGSAGDEAFSLAVDGAGNVYVTGRSYKNVAYDNEYATIKYNPSGVEQWVARYNGPGYGDDLARSLAVDGYGNVYVTGRSEGNGTGYDYATIKYNTYGVQQWVQRYYLPGSGYGQDIAQSIKVDGYGNVYVTGGSAGLPPIYGSDYATIKYSQPIGITPISNQIPSSYILYQNYPNPFNPQTNIDFSLPYAGFTSLKIYDIMGRVVNTLVDEQLITGKYSFLWDAEKFTSGIYFYRLESGDYFQSRKMILLK